MRSLSFEFVARSAYIANLYDTYTSHVYDVVLDMCVREIGPPRLLEAGGTHVIGPQLKNVNLILTPSAHRCLI